MSTLGAQVLFQNFILHNFGVSSVGAEDLGLCQVLGKCFLCSPKVGQIATP